MKNVIEIINELKARRTEIASNQDMAAIGELANINATLETLKSYYNHTDFDIDLWDFTSTGYAFNNNRFTGRFIDLGDAFDTKDRYVYEIKINEKDSITLSPAKLSPAQMDIVINALQNAKAEMNDE